VPPGSYDIQVIFTRARDVQVSWAHGVSLEGGRKYTEEVAFNSGELSVEAVVGSDAGQALVYVFHPGDHNRVITSMPTGTPVLIAPGEYDLRVVLNDASGEKDVRWQENVPVQAGLQTRVRVPYHRGSLLIEARNGDQELPVGAVELAVYRAGDQNRELLDTGTAGTPVTLSAGRYDIAATFTASHDQPMRWLLDVEVEEDRTLDHQVSFDSGTLVITAKLADGDALERFQAYAYYYLAGKHEEAVAYSSVFDPVVLAAGLYDVRVNFFRSQDRPDIWIRDLRVSSGKQITRGVEFPSGQLLVRAFDAAGLELIGDTVFIHVYAAGERTRPVAVARSGQMITLTEGLYDVAAEDSRQPGERRWLERLQVASGARSAHSIKY
jgi:hypothetical protein